MLSGLALLLVGVLFLSLSGSVASAQPTGKQYIILIDAGSSGCRLHVHSYTWDGPGSLPVVDPSKNQKLKPGLSSYAKTPSQAADSVRELKLFAEEHVPVEARPSTKVLLQATAGLRVLPEEEAEAILETVRDDLVTWGFRFERSWARIVPGSEEGINSFLAANYLKGVFAAEGAAQQDTFGVIEMGGASLQLTFCPDNVDQMSPEQKNNLYPVSVGGSTYWVYTVSYLGYGLEKAAETLQLEEMDRIEEEGNPCALVHSKHSGAGDFAACRGLIKHALFFDDERTHACPSCSFHGEYLPPMAGENFLAIENFFYTTQFFGIEKEATFVEKLEVAGEEWCGKDYADVTREKADLDKADINKYCFASAYITAFLTGALHFSLSEVSHDVHIAREINGSGIDWALGAVLAAIQDPGGSAGLWGTWLPWAAVVLVVAGVLGYTLKRRSGNARYMYSAVSRV